LRSLSSARKSAPAVAPYVRNSSSSSPATIRSVGRHWRPSCNALAPREHASSTSPSRNASRLGRLGWSLAVLRPARRCDGDRRARWPAVLAPLLVMRPLDGKIAHLPLDDAWIASASARWIDLTNHLGEQQDIVIITMREGENAPVSRFWTG
jgi:hypothetical protein